MTTTTEIDPDAWYVCIGSVYIGGMGVQAGTRVHSINAWLRAAPTMFEAEDSLKPEEWAARWVSRQVPVQPVSED